MIWVIEATNSNGQTVWLESATGFTPDVDGALWFVRQDDAKRLLASVRLQLGIGGEVRPHAGAGPFGDPYLSGTEQLLLRALALAGLTHYSVTKIKPDARAVLVTDFAAEGTALKLCHVRWNDLSSIETVHNTAEVTCDACRARFELVLK